MLAIVGLAMLAFVGSCTWVGVRLLRLARRGGGSAALLCGTGFCLIAILGFPLGVASGNGPAPAGEVSFVLAAVSHAASALGIGCFSAFSVRVFRPSELWARALAGAASATLAMSAVGVLASLAMAPSAAPSFEASFAWAAIFHGACVVCFGWIGAEGLLEWSRSRRRVALGLSDPAVCNRLLMWGLFGASATLLCALLLGVHLSGQATATSPVAQLGQAAFGVGSSVAVLLAFFPRARAGAGAPAPAGMATRVD